MPGAADLVPFRVEVAEEVLEDLRDRLARTRWPDQLPGTGWSYGTDLDYLPRSVRLLADGLRLAQGRGGAQRLPAVRDDRRRPPGALPARALARARRHPDGPHPRMARLGHRVPLGHRTADRPGRPRRRPRRCVPSRRTVAARIRLLRPDHRDRCRRSRHRHCLRRADGEAGLRQLRRPGRRHRRNDLDAARRDRRRPRRRGPREPAPASSPRPNQPAGGAGR